jgi:hypothetical protein
MVDAFFRIDQVTHQVQDIGNTLWARSVSSGMPWKPQTQMNQRMEFVMRAQTTENFRALCREYGISPKVGYKWNRRFVQHGLEGPHGGKPQAQIQSHGVERGGGVPDRAFPRTASPVGNEKIHELYQRGHWEAPSQSPGRDCARLLCVVRAERQSLFGKWRPLQQSFSANFTAGGSWYRRT